MTAEIIYEGNLRTTMTHLESGIKVNTDAPKDNHGLGAAFSPTDLVASALGSCMFSIMGIAARTHEITMEGMRATIEKLMVADPQRRIQEIRVDIFPPPQVEFSAKDRLILEKAALTCPVMLSLSENLQKTVRFHW
jgi:putative redox protein